MAVDTKEVKGCINHDYIRHWRDRLLPVPPQVSLRALLRVDEIGTEATAITTVRVLEYA